MQGLNKIIGGLLGFLVAGPGGCLVGVLIGHVFDKHHTFQKPSQSWEEFWVEIKEKAHYYEEKEKETTLLFERELKKAYEALELCEKATQVEVKKAYRKAMSRYHPDRLANQGLSDSELEKATQKAQQIKDAYELICKTKKFPKT